MSDNFVAFPRRHRRRDFLTIGAAAAAAVGAGIGPAQSDADGVAAADPILALIAKEDAIRTAGVRLQEAAFVLGLKDASGDAIVDQADELFDQIVATRPTTVAGAAAKFEILFADPSEHYDAMLADLRALAAKGGAT